MRLFPGRKKRLPRISPGRTFSQAFEKIVLQDDDIIGLIAYDGKYGVGANEDRIEQWASDHLTEDKIEDYRKRAFELVETYRTLEIINSNKEAYEHIASTHDKVKALTGARGFVASVATGQISFLCSILMAGLLFIACMFQVCSPCAFLRTWLRPPNRANRDQGAWLGVRRQSGPTSRPTVPPPAGTQAAVRLLGLWLTLRSPAMMTGASAL